MLELKQPNVQVRLEYLQEMHDTLDKEIEKQFKNYGEDNLVTVMKKKKLQLKDEIEKLKKYENSSDN